MIVVLRALIVQDADGRDVDFTFASSSKAFPVKDEKVGRRVLVGQRLELVDQVVEAAGGFNAFNIWNEIKIKFFTIKRPTSITRSLSFNPTLNQT